MAILVERRNETRHRVDEICEKLKATEQYSQGKACVYATGSFGRGEASRHSDLDLFIVGRVDDKSKSLLRRLDEICIKADLIDLTRKLKIPDFSGDGKYLEFHTISGLTKTLGKPEDDVTNTFTARLLLLLESCSLLEPTVYREITDEIIAAYWGDFEDHKNSFMPAFLANDILRLWRTFCVNYEAGTSKEPEEEKAKRKLKNYKLKHSRLLTCYSALLYLLAIFSKHKTVSPQDVAEMIKLTPTERLEWLRSQPDLSRAEKKIGSLLEQYELFLDVTASDPARLLDQFRDKEVSRKHVTAATKFGDLVFDVLNDIGQGNQFHRLLVV